MSWSTFWCLTKGKSYSQPCNPKADRWLSFTVFFRDPGATQILYFPATLWSCYLEVIPRWGHVTTCQRNEGGGDASHLWPKAVSEAGVLRSHFLPLPPEEFRQQQGPNFSCSHKMEGIWVPKLHHEGAPSASVLHD